MRRFLSKTVAVGLSALVAAPVGAQDAQQRPYFRYPMDTWLGAQPVGLYLNYPAGEVVARANEPFFVQAYASGVDAGSVFAVTGGMPAGLALSGNGSLIGASATPTSFPPLTVTLTTGKGKTVTASTPRVTVLPQLRFAYPSVLTGVAGAQFVAAPLVWDGVGGATRVELVSGSIPSGIRPDPSTGLLSGIPDAPGETVATFALVDASDGRRVSTGETRFVISAAGPLALTASTPPDGTVNQGYPAFGFTATGGRAPMTFGLAAGSAMPPGLTLQASGAVVGTPTADGSYQVTVRVRDFDGREVTGQSTFKVNRSLIITAPAIARATVGQPVPQVTYTVANADGTARWAQTGLPPEVTLSAAGILSGTPATAGSYPFTVTVTDASNHTAGTAGTLSVDAPFAAKGPDQLPLGATNAAYAAQTFTATGGNGTPSWSATGLPSGLSITSGGRLQGTPRAAGSFKPTFTARDASGRTDSVTLDLTVTAVFAASAPNAPLASVGTAYGPLTFTSAGGNGTVTWTLASGTPPGTVTLTAGGVLSGVPDTPGTYPLTARATDADGKTADAGITVSVANPVTITGPSSLPRGTVGTAYTSDTGTPFAGSGGRGGVTVSASNLLNGLSLVNGVVQGSPQASGTRTVTVTARDADGRTASLTRTLAVDPALAVTSATLPADVSGVQMAPFGLQASGGRGAVTWTVDPSQLHLGVSAVANGVLTGTPTSTGTRTFTATATDIDGRTATGTFSHTVDPNPTRPAISGAPPGSFAAGASIDVRPFTVTGGQGPYVFSVATGAPPAGIQLASDGRLYGTTTYAGTWSFGVRVTDALGRTGEAGPYVMQSTGSYTITGSLPSTGRVGQPYAAQFYVTAAPTGGNFFAYRRTETSSWSSASQTVFPGVTIDPATGKVSGSPTTAGTYDGIEIWHNVGTWVAIGTFTVTVSP